SQQAHGLTPLLHVLNGVLECVYRPNLTKLTSLPSPKKLQTIHLASRPTSHTTIPPLFEGEQVFRGGVMSWTSPLHIVARHHRSESSSRSIQVAGKPLLRAR
ncbi:hypothetical protein EC973_004334, partial [Apophysomyces ossiformis]